MLIAQADVIRPAVVIFLFVLLLAVFMVVQALAPWLQAIMSGVPLRIVEVLDMRFRRIDVKAVVQTLIRAKQSGVPLSRAEVERAYLRGADIEKVTLAFVRATKNNLGFTFEQLVEADLAN